MDQNKCELNAEVLSTASISLAEPCLASFIHYMAPPCVPKKLFFFKHVVLQTKYGVFACLILVGLGGRGVHNFCKVTLYVIIHVTFRIGIGIHPLKYRDPILWNWDIVFEIHIIFPASKKWDFLWHFHFVFQEVRLIEVRLDKWVPS